jgi:hypothetical protein
MKLTTTNGTGRVIRVLLLGLLVWLGWAGIMPVTAAAETVSIGTAADLTTFATRVNAGETSLNGVLTANITLRNTDNWTAWSDTQAPADIGSIPAWIPIGNDVNRYTGIFDGAGWTISGIYINAPGADYQGLFGCGTNMAIIKNLGVVESYISGQTYTGGVAGLMLGTMSSCYNSGTVKGAINSVGGVAGNAQEVINCYNTGVVSGDEWVGGVVGMGANISNCYNTGAVRGTGVVGSVAAHAGMPTKCYYLTGSAVLSNGVVVEGFGDWSDAPSLVEVKPATAFASGEVAYLLNKFIGYWTQNSGDATPSLTSDSTKAINQQITFNYGVAGLNSYGYCYPNWTILTLPTPPDGSLYTYKNGGIIRSQATLASYDIVGDLTFTVDQYNLTVNGDGVIEMDTAAELTEFARYVNAGNTGANGKLMANIALRNTDNWTSWSDAQAPADILANPQWIPIGNDTTHQYNGTFDGAGWTVSGIYINDSGLDCQGLFGFGNGGATIKNLGVVESYIRGGTCTGGVVAHLTGTTTGCFNSGTVKGAVNLVGGVIGYGLGTISNCYNSGDVTGINYVGGVIGDGGEVINCYNTGMVSGTTYVGSVAGYVYSITNCYYLTGTATTGFGYLTNAPGTVEAKPDTAFTSGEVTWRLQNAQADQTVAVWGQKLDDPNKDTMPVLKATDRVYVITLMKGNGTDLYRERYRNGSSIVNLPEPAAYTWQDAGGTVYPVVSDAADHILVPSITTLPTATAVYGTKLGAITFSGGSVPLSAWSWSGTPAELDQLPALGNAVGYPATYTAADDIFGTQTFTINPTIKSPGGGGGYSPPGMSGITITPGSLSFDPTGQLVVDITGLPAGATVYYSLDGISYSTTPPVMTRAGAQQLYLRISCPGYQDYNTQTTVTVAKQEAPVLPPLPVFVPGGQSLSGFDLGALLPPGRGFTQFSLGGITDPGGILAGLPFISPDGLLSFSLLLNLAASQPPSAASELAAATTAAQTATIEVLVTMENYEDTILTLVVTESEPLGVRYLTHIQDIGWETDWAVNGELSGTAGQSKRLEALKVELTGTNLPAGASIETAVHVQNQGDLGPFAMGSAAGTSGLGLRLENICLTLNNLPGYSLRYNVHVQNQGWLRDEADSSSWFSSGEVAGTAGLSLRLEGIRIELVKDE